MKWWIYLNEEVSDRPYEESELEELDEFSESTLVCPEGDEDWIEAGQVEALKDLLSSGSVSEETDGDLRMPKDVKKRKEKEEKELRKLTQSVLKLAEDDNFQYGFKKAALLLTGL